MKTEKKNRIQIDLSEDVLHTIRELSVKKRFSSRKAFIEKLCVDAAIAFNTRKSIDHRHEMKKIASDFKKKQK